MPYKHSLERARRGVMLFAYANNAPPRRGRSTQLLGDNRADCVAPRETPHESRCAV